MRARKVDDRCPSWADGQHLFTPSFLGRVFRNPISDTVIGWVARKLEIDDHRTEAKSCRCGKIVRAVSGEKPRYETVAKLKD